MHDDECLDDLDDAADGVWLPPESLRALMRRPRHRPARLVWNGTADGPAAQAATQWL